MLYHGSPRLLDALTPRNEHGDPELGDVVFASPSRIFAVVYAGATWGDRDLEQAVYYDQADSIEEMALREMRPGAFTDTFHRRRGYLYHLDATPFEPPPGRTSPWEVVSPVVVAPLHVEVVEDVGAALEADLRVTLHLYDPDAPENEVAVRRQVARMQQMTPEGRAEYLRWRLEPAPPRIRQLFGELGGTALST